jgi:hypothetical protein
MTVLLAWTCCFLFVFFLINKELYGMIFPSTEALYGLKYFPKEAIHGQFQPTKETFSLQNMIHLPMIHNMHDLSDAIITLIVRSPKILAVLFSSEFGLAYNSTILFVGTLSALIYLASHLKKHLLQTFITIFMICFYIALPMAIILFWQYAGSMYGYRFLFCLFPIALLGFCTLYNKLIARYTRLDQFPNRIKSYLEFFWIFCAFGLIASLCWELNENLMYHPGLNSFGVMSTNANAINYNLIVLSELAHLSTWYDMMIERTLGFYYVGFLDMFHIPYEQSNFFKRFTEFNNNHLKCTFNHLPARVYIQVTILCAFFIGSGIILCKQASIIPKK